MSDQAWKLVRQLTGPRWLKVFVVAVVSALTGCFGAPAMHYDIQEYNKQALSSEKEMLLYNIGELHYQQPPHFMMLSEVDQTRAFTASAGFQWTHLWNSLFIAKDTTDALTARGTNTWQAGPFTAGASESPTVKFNPIQGQEFASRFESPLTTKFTLFLEDQRWSSTSEERAWLVGLFAQSLLLKHGDGRLCRNGLYFNRWQREAEDSQGGYYYADEFSKCVDAIIRWPGLRFAQVDAHHIIPTNTAGAPTADNVVSALTAGFEWYSPSGLTATRQRSTTEETSNVEEEPGIKPHTKGGKTTISRKKSSADTTTVNSGNFVLTNPVKLPAWLTYSSSSISPTYGDQIVDDAWPAPQDYFYVELLSSRFGRDEAERECHSSPPADSPGGVVCGYFKIGNLLWIMQHLAETACTYEDEDAIAAHCSKSIFGIGTRIPPWAENSAPYRHLAGPYKIQTESIWVPAHNPRGVDKKLAERDRWAFFALYKLYQMSLVDTSKLVTGSTPITISK